MRLPHPFHTVGEHIAIELDGANVTFTTRRGGVSKGPYASLNLGRWTDDDAAAVEHNRARLASELGVRFAYGRQVHGATVTRASKPLGDDEDAPRADGQATAVRGIGTLVLTADCLPIALAAQGAVAMLHAGWRGLEAGVVVEGVNAIRDLGGAGPIQAAIGPGAGICCYEVGEELHARFAGYGTSVRRGRNLDLKAIARAELDRAGVVQTHDVGICTICSKQFFSHRRDRGVTGRQAGVAWLT